MPYYQLNISYDREKILSEVSQLNYSPLVQHLDGKTYPDWQLAALPKNSYSEKMCDNIVNLFETSLLVPARALRFMPPQINERHIDGPLAKGVINIVIGDGFYLEIEDLQYEFHTSIFDVKKEHRLLNIHSTIYLVRMDVEKVYHDLVTIGRNKQIIRT
jgi:hypothetical protein